MLSGTIIVIKKHYETLQLHQYHFFKFKVTLSSILILELHFVKSFND